jgi:hypothetical protein
MVEEALIFATPNLEDEQAAPFYLLTHSARRRMYVCLPLRALFVSLAKTNTGVYIYDRHIHMWGAWTFFFSVCSKKSTNP